MRPYKLIKFSGAKDDRWFYNVTAPNGKVVLDSGEGYSTRASRERAISKLEAELFQPGSYVVVEQ